MDTKETIGITPDRLSGNEIGGILGRMEGVGYITDALGPEIVELARQREVEPDQVMNFCERRIMPDGLEVLNEIATEQGLDLNEPVDYVNALRAVSKQIEIRKEEEPRRVEIGEVIEDGLQGTGVELNRALVEGPSSLIADQIDEQLQRTVGETSAGKVPFGAWIFNPRAAARALAAVAREATARAGVQKQISETTAWLANLAGQDARRDALLSYVGELEESLGQHVEGFCQKNGLTVPGKNTPERWDVLIKINTEISGMQAEAGAIIRAVEELLKERVEIQAETARNRMLARELPAKTETAKEANAAREEAVAEEVRSAFARITSALTGGVVGIVGGTMAGIESSVRTLVERHPKTAIAIGSGLGTFTLYVANSGFSSEVIISAARGGLIITAVAAVATGVGSGLVARFNRGKEELEMATPR